MLHRKRLFRMLARLIPEAGRDVYGETPSKAVYRLGL